MKTWQQRRDAEHARRAEVEATLAQIRRGRTPATVCTVCGTQTKILADGWCLDCGRIMDAIQNRPHPAPPPPPEPLALVVDLADRRAEVPLRVASQPPAAERCACGHKGISHPRFGPCNRTACTCPTFRGCA